MHCSFICFSFRSSFRSRAQPDFSDGNRFVCNCNVCLLCSRSCWANEGPFINEIKSTASLSQYQFTILNSDVYQLFFVGVVVVSNLISSFSISTFFARCASLRRCTTNAIIVCNLYNFRLTRARNGHVNSIPTDWFFSKEDRFAMQIDFCSIGYHYKLQLMKTKKQMECKYIKKMTF